MSENKNKQPKEPKLWHALLCLGFMIAMLVIGIVVFKVDPQIPMYVGAIFTVMVCLFIGFKWEFLQKAMVNGISKTLTSVIILVIIGILIGVWIDAGVVPSMIYYGLKILKPRIFYLAAFLIMCVTSLSTGTSWGAMGTLGVALMGIGYGLELSPAITAGAIISGAYFGDKMSPLSDTTTLAPAMAGTDVMTHVKFMLLPGGICFAVCVAAYLVLGFIQYNGGAADMSAIEELSAGLQSQFTISPFLLLPPVLVIVAIALKVPAIMGITIGVFVGGIFGLIFQPDCTMQTLFACGMDGYSCSSGVEIIDSLLNSGGIMSMMFSVAMTIVAMMFGGVMDETGMLQIIVNKLKKISNTPAKLVTLTEATCIASNAIMPEQFVSIVIPGSMYAEEYKKQGIHPAALSNALESAGTVTSALIPWNTCGLFIFSTLGIATGQYAFWAFFNWLSPVVTLILAYAGVTVADMNGVRLYKKKKQQAPEV